MTKRIGTNGERVVDANAVVSENLKWIRKRRGMTQVEVAEALGRLTGRTLPQASISGREAGLDGTRRRRFDAHELYLLSVVFDVPIIYFFLPSGGFDGVRLADSGESLVELLGHVLGEPEEVAIVDERLAECRGYWRAASAEGGLSEGEWREWRAGRVVELAEMYGGRLEEVGEFLGELADQLKKLSPCAYLQGLVDGDPAAVDPAPSGLSAGR